MQELLFYALFLLLFAYGTWLLFSSWQELFSNAHSKARKPSDSGIPPQSSTSPLGVDMGPGTVCNAKRSGDVGAEQDRADIAQPNLDPPTVSSHDKPSVTEVATAERQRIEREHRSILAEVLQEILSEHPTPFETIYEKYVEKCNTQECERRLGKPRVRSRVRKAYLREMAEEGKLKRVMKGREYFYVVAED